MLLLTFEVKQVDIDGKVFCKEQKAFCSELRLNEALTQITQNIKFHSEVFTLLHVSQIDFLNEQNHRDFNVRQVETGVRNVRF